VFSFNLHNIVRHDVGHQANIFLDRGPGVGNVMVEGITITKTSDHTKTVCSHC